MSLPDRNNPYTFDEFLAWREGVDYYFDDAFLRQVVEHYAGDEFSAIEEEMRSFSKKVSFRWRDMADSAAWPEKRPLIRHYDGHHRRIDRIVRPHEVEVMEREVFSEAVYSDNTSPWMRLVKLYLIQQNGEACISCPLACTEGLVAALEKFADSSETKEILRHCKEGIAGEFAIGAQYLSEIQGGSDIPANLLEAVQEPEGWKLYGDKFFCSATHADYSIVTAKPKGSEKPALFVIPSWLPGDKEKEVRNGYTIDRIKWKMGTSELTTGEMTFKGALAYPLGPLERGVANAVGLVLTHSRLFIGMGAGGQMARAVREAKQYAAFRQAFGFSIASFPMLAGQLAKMEKMARRTTAGAFRIYDAYMKLPGGLMGGLSSDEPLELKKKRFELRELIMLQKITCTWDSTDLVREAMSVFGGHGVMEDFSSLPRLYRDSAVNELWEGPRNVLLTQIHRDFQRVSDWYTQAEFIENILPGVDEDLRRDLAEEMTELVSCSLIGPLSDEIIERCERWDMFCHEFFHAYQDQALMAVEKA